MIFTAIYMSVNEVGREGRGRSERSERGRREGPCTELVHDLQSVGSVYMDGEMDLWIWNEIGRAWSGGVVC
jgi:hypothetical protein